MTLAELLMGHQPLTNLELAYSKSQQSCLVAYRFAWDKQEMILYAKKSLVKATKRMKKYADNKRRALEF